MFAEDVGIFPDNQFSQILFNHAGNKGEEAREVIIAAFTAMNQPKDKRSDLPAWAGDLEYVNGGLFAGSIDAPVFDVTAYRYLRDACNEDWREINPDIFGSMIQSVADPKQRSELGMHYTSVPNIMKVIGPLFLDDLDAEIDKAWDRAGGLRRALTRIEGIRVFDPACGSGNFLVVSYRQLRIREMRILERLEELTGESTKEMFSAVKIANFHGIEITDFAAETAKLALFIAEYQANAVFKEVFGQGPASLPLRESAHIVCDNALRVDWEEVCPPPGGGEEVFIAGNPPFVGFNARKEAHKRDMDHVLKGRLKTYHRLDYVICWFIKAADFLRGHNAEAAFVSTNSVCQGATVDLLWGEVLRDGMTIKFAHQQFYWSNNASRNAAVSCVIIGLSDRHRGQRRLIGGDLEASVNNINPYLVDGPNLTIKGVSRSMFGLPKMDIGNIPRDEGNLILTREERDHLISDHPDAEQFIRRFLGSKEVVRGLDRFCLWIRDNEVETAKSIPEITRRLKAVTEIRAESDAQVTRDAAAYPHRFGQMTGDGEAKEHSFLIPRVTSVRRPYLPVERFGADVISSDLNQVIYDAPEWAFSIVASRLHLVWVATVSGKLKNDFRYSSTMGWNTFPVPNFSDDQLEALNASTRKILKCRYSHYPATIAQLYDPDKMPDDLRAVHRENDELLETMYIGRPFRNDTERLEHLFKLYAAKIKQIEKQAAKGKRGKRSK
ncbi:class I SAM-dependent DNA methyltransferase [Phaeobacter piscinae]|nr:DNA methyltransferase [Phaeobacter piscinae]